MEMHSLIMLPKCIDNEDEQIKIKVCRKLFPSTLGYKVTTVVDFLFKAFKELHGTKLTKHTGTCR